MKKKILENKKSICLIIFFSILISILNVISPMLVGTIIDRIVEIEWQEFIKYLLYLGIIYLLIYVLSYLQNKFLSKFVTDIQYKIRKELFEKITNLKIKELDKSENGDILNSFSMDIENISIGIMQGVPKIINGITTVLILGIIMLKINIYLALIVIAIAPIMYCVSRFVTKSTNKFFKERANIIGKLNNNSEEFVTYQELIKDFNYEKYRINEFNKINQELYKTGVKAQFYSSLTNPSTRIVSNLAYIIVGIVGTVLMIKNQVTIGNISSFLMYTNIFNRPFNEITSILTEIQTAKASFNRIQEFMIKDEEENIGKEEISFNGDIEFKDVEFSYTENKFIEKFNLKVKNGEKIAIVGRTGAGKTTIINMILRFYDIKNGEILIDGVNIKNIDLKCLRRNIGIVLQDTKLFTGTVSENIRYGMNNISNEEIKRVARLANADSFINKLPQKYDTIINNDVLSAGEIQLITIARAMLRNPKILILDEATSNVDLVTENKIQNSMLELMKNRTTFIIAHRLSTIKNADRIIYLENGNIMEQGTHKELMNKKGKYYQMYINQ